MAEYQAGLHRQVSIIFSEVYRLGLQQSPDEDATTRSRYIKSRQLASEQYAASKTQTSSNNGSLDWVSLPRRSLLTGTKRAFINLFNIFVPKARREEKRLANIRRHLLINLQG